MCQWSWHHGTTLVDPEKGPATAGHAGPAWGHSTHCLWRRDGTAGARPQLGGPQAPTVFRGPECKSDVSGTRVACAGMCV